MIALDFAQAAHTAFGIVCGALVVLYLKMGTVREGGSKWPFCPNLCFMFGLNFSKNGSKIAVFVEKM